MTRRIDRGHRLAGAVTVWFAAAGFAATSVLSACAGEQTRRYETLSSALRASSPGRAAGAGGDALAFARSDTLERAELVAAVLERNPSIEAARQAFRAALAQRDAATALDDPMLEYSLAPLSIGSSDVPFGQTITLSQRIPWPGKLSLKGEIALAEAEAAQQDYEATRRRLALMAASLFDEYYAVTRSLELSAAHRALVEELKRASEGRYSAGQGAQQEILQAEVELAQIERDELMLLGRSAVLVAQMNGLLRRDPELPLPPPPPGRSPSLAPAPDAAALRAKAIAERPELRAAHAALRGGQSAIELAKRQYYPDLGVMGSYSSMWSMPEHQWMLGLAVSLPLSQSSRDAGVDGARAQLAAGRARLQSERDAVAVQVETARQQVIEAQRVVELYGSRLLPATEAGIEAARIGFATGQSSFTALIEAERALRSAELGHQQALAQLGQSWARLEHAIGVVPGVSERGAVP